MLGKLKGAATLAKQAYDAGQAQSAQAQLAGQALQGPAGRHVAGVEKAPDAQRRIEDPAEWERVMRAELAPRAAAREPYLAPARSPLRISRIVTRGATQGEEVAAHLAACGLAGRPEEVYGVYRVPDRIRPSAGAEKGRVVEWDVVHAATEPLGRAEVPADVYFDARTTWVARGIGEPRRPVPAREYGMGKLERGANRVADAVSYFDPDTSNEPGPPPPRYCWPPAR
jgi:hypothetical protein